PNQWHTASIEKRGDIYSLFVDNAALGYYNDTFLNGQGKVGLHTYGTVRYDNFSLETCDNPGTGYAESTFIENQDVFSIYPNPAINNIIYFEIFDKAEINSISPVVNIYDTQGLLIGNEIVINKDITPINIESLPKGIYIVVCQSEYIIKSKRLIVY
ncbi:MAG: T9SS type A sorting domain-containing protein, partial [Bacteroidales bacterium]|nr:T9SS type A sorting domain-containing protein [Bacteroidales bacterium]